MVSTTSDRPSPTRSNGSPRIDESVFSAIGSVESSVTVAEFERWFACFASAGDEE